jgi:GTP-binding protein
LVVRGGDTFRFVDTAGIRRKARIAERLEAYMVMSALRSLEHADVVILVLDVTELATDQDAKIAALCHDRGKGLIIAVNKWDVGHEQINARNLKEELAYHFPFLNYARVLYVSAKTGQGVERLFDEIRAVLAERQKRISTGELNRFLGKVLEAHPPPLLRGKRAKVYYGAQVHVAPPTFVLQVNDPKRVPASYHRYLINSLREAFGFSGMPIVLRLTSDSKAAKGVEERERGSTSRTERERKPEGKSGRKPERKSERKPERKSKALGVRKR